MQTTQAADRPRSKSRWSHEGFITATSAAELAGVPSRRLVEWAARGLVATRKLPGSPPRYLKADVERLVEACTSTYSCPGGIISDSVLADTKIRMQDKIVLMTITPLGAGVDYALPSVEDVAEKSGITVDQARQSLARLAKLGMISADADPSQQAD